MGGEVTTPTRSITLTRADQGYTCPHCNGPLDLHQPLLDRPSEFLAVCESCIAWGVVIETNPPNGAYFSIPLSKLHP